MHSESLLEGQAGPLLMGLIVARAATPDSGAKAMPRPLQKPRSYNNLLKDNVLHGHYTRAEPGPDSLTNR